MITINKYDAYELHNILQENKIEFRTVHNKDNDKIQFYLNSTPEVEEYIKNIVVEMSFGAYWINLPQYYTIIDFQNLVESYGLNIIDSKKRLFNRGARFLVNGPQNQVLTLKNFIEKEL